MLIWIGTLPQRRGKKVFWMSTVVYAFVLYNEQQKALNRSNVKFIWFEKLDKQRKRWVHLYKGWDDWL